MANEEQSSSEKQPAKLPESSSPTIGNKINEIKEEDHKPSNDTECDNKQPLIVKIDKSKGLSNAEKISLLGVLISGSLFFMTLKAFKKTSEAVNISANALADARKRDTKDSLSRIKYDSIAKDERDTANKRNTDSYNLAQQSLQAQITSIKETQRQFEAENRPFVQMADMRIDSFEIGKKPVFLFKFINMGKLPAKLIESENVLYFDFPSNEETILKGVGKKIIYSNSLISNTSNLGAEAIFEKPLSESGYSSFINHKMFFYVNMKYKYTSVSTRKNYVSICIFKLGYGERSLSVTGLKNEDHPIDR